MDRRVMSGLLLAVLVATGGLRGTRGDDDPTATPDRDATRKQIDTLIAGFEKDKKKATLGLLQQAIDLSIEYGAPAWNQGDHEACCKFYLKTVESLLKAFGPAGATAQGQAALADLKTALERAKATADYDKGAWALRFAFDKTRVTIETEVAKSEELMSLGDECMKRADFESAQDAYGGAQSVLQEMDGCDKTQIPLACSSAPLARASALFALKRFEEAGAEVSRGLASLPEFAGSKADVRAVYGDVDLYESLMDDLKTQAGKSPKDASLQFLLGYHYFFTGHKKEAKEQADLTLRLDPGHVGAKVLEQAIEKAAKKGKSADKGGAI